MEETWLYKMSPSGQGEVKVCVYDEVDAVKSGLMYLRNVKTDVIVELSGKRSSGDVAAC